VNATNLPATGPASVGTEAVIGMLVVLAGTALPRRLTPTQQGGLNDRRRAESKEPGSH
jgi:hypothetical protein